MPETIRLYLQDEPIFVAHARIVAVRGNEVAVDRSPFYPGGGGQPPDEGQIRFENGETLKVTSAFSDDRGIIWHTTDPLPRQNIVGQIVQMNIDQERRLALTRYHTVLHVLNTIALRDYGAWITGVQIGIEYSRIDFKFENFSPAVAEELETRVNRVLAKNCTLKAYSISEAEFAARPDLLRTLTVKPPIHNGQVRVVEIEGFDTQACGGTHVHNTGEIGNFSIFRTENKGRINKRFYIRLD